MNPQYHAVFDDKFTTVKYLQSSEEPPNWQNLLTHHTDQSTDEEQQLAEAWLHPHMVTSASEYPVPVVPEVIDEVIGKSAVPEIQASEGELLHISCADPPLPEGVSSVPISPGEDETREDTFVNLDTLGLRRGTRKKTVTAKLQESRKTDPKNKSLLFHKPHALMILALTAFTTQLTEGLQISAHAGAAAINIGAKCYQARAIK